MILSMFKRAIDWWLLGILIIAVVVRSLFFGQQPSGTYWDETAILVDAKALAETGRDMHGLSGWQLIFPSYGDYKMPVLIWLAAASVKFFGVSAWALRLPSLLAGIATVWVSYALAKRVWPNQPHAAHFSALAVALAPWDIIFSKTAFEGHVAQFFLALSALLLLSKKNRWLTSVLGAFFGVVATYTYFSVRFVWPIVLLGVCAIIWSELPLKQKWNLRSMLKLGWLQLLLPAVFFIVLMIPMSKSPFYDISNAFRLNADSVLKSQDWPLISNQDRKIAGNQFLDRFAFHRHWLMAQALFENYGDHLNLSYLFLNGDSNLRHGTGSHGVFLLIWLPAFVLGWIVIWSKSPVVGASLLLWWLAALLPASVPETTPHALRSLNALVPLCLVMGLGASSILSWITQLNKKIPIIAVSLVIASTGLMVVSIWDFLLYYHTSYQQLAYQSWQSDFNRTINTILFFRKQNQPVYIEHSDDKFFLWTLQSVDFRHKPANMVEKNFQFTQIGDLHFGKIALNNLHEYSGALILIKPERLTELTANQNLQPQIYQTITDASGSYVLAQMP